MTARGFPAFPPVATGAMARTWWGREWVRALEDTALDQRQLREGRKYARAGYVGAITASPGLLSASVRDYEDDTTYVATVRLPVLDSGEWGRFLDQVSRQAGHLAALLDGEVPRELVDAAADAGVSVLPGVGELDPECSCPGWELPCRHAAALAYQVAWLVDADPFVLLLLRGRDAEAVVAGLRTSEPAVAAFARVPSPLPDPPPVPSGDPVVLEVPAAEGVDPAEVAALITTAARRARALLTDAAA